jgi:outer membrane immunogenic protein
VLPPSHTVGTLPSEELFPAHRRRQPLKTASNWFGTFRARFGYAWDRVLLYGTAGGAGVNVQTSLNGLPAQTNPEFGWTVGAGLEWAFADNRTAKVEYLFLSN